MNILMADKFPEEYQKKLISKGYEIIFNPDLTADDLPNNIENAQVLIVRSTRVTEQTLENAKQLKLIIRAGAGTNTIAVEEAAKKGIAVCNCPGKNAIAVSELAFGLLLSIDRNIPDNVIELRKEKWNKKGFQKTKGLFGRNIGVVGTGQIGLYFAERAHAFGMKVHVLEKKEGRAKETEARLAAMKVTYVSNYQQLAEKCSVISFHVPAKSETKGLIGKEFLSYVKPETIILNTSRGEIVDDLALIDAMDQKNIRAGLDVYNNEPGSGTGDFSTLLTLHQNVYGTHHIGASTEQAQTAIAVEVMNIIEQFEQGNVINCVNRSLL